MFQYFSSSIANTVKVIMVRPVTAFMIVKRYQNLSYWRFLAAEELALYLKKMCNEDATQFASSKKDFSHMPCTVVTR